MKHCNCQHPLPPPSGGPAQHTGSMLYPDTMSRTVPYNGPWTPVPVPSPEPFPVRSGYNNVEVVGAGDISVTKDENVLVTTYTIRYDGVCDLGYKNESDLIDGALVIERGNSNTELALSTLDALTVKANGGVPNFILLIDNSANSNSVLVTVTDSTGATVFYPSVSKGNTVRGGAICQLKCIGRCWTMDEYRKEGY